MPRRATTTLPQSTRTASCDFSCYGCTEAAACNYDPAATINDGSCIDPDPNFGCDCALDGAQNATLSGGQSSTPLLIEATANPNPSNFDITLNFTGAGGSWPADMAVAITDPNGVCVAFGGYNDSPSGCSSLGNYTTIWPTDWNTSTSGTYSATVDLSGTSLERQRNVEFCALQWLVHGGHGNL